MILRISRNRKITCSRSDRGAAQAAFCESTDISVFAINRSSLSRHLAYLADPPSSFIHRYSFPRYGVKNLLVRPEPDQPLATKGKIRIFRGETRRPIRPNIILKPINMPVLPVRTVMDQQTENQSSNPDIGLFSDFAFIDLWINRLGRATDSVLGSPSSAFR